MNITERIEAFAGLGEALRNSLSGSDNEKSEGINKTINEQQTQNPWFTPGNVTYAIRAIAEELTYANLTLWTNAYPQLHKPAYPLKAGVIMAGNIPLAGFHDFLSILISGNKLTGRTSSKDSSLILMISEMLCEINPHFREMIEFTDGFLKDFDVVIATGSNNSSRYFEYYFGKYPNIIRKNRNSVAIIDGNETQAELEALGKDIFLYFGLGCRNVSKIFLPEGYDIRSLFNGWNQYADLMNHVKYANNYDFNKAVFLVNRERFFDTGYLLVKQDKSISSPVAVLYYEYYKSLSDVDHEMQALRDKIQCVVGHNDIPFGKAQSPYLWDYADGIDTVEFLSKKNKAGIL